MQNDIFSRLDRIERNLDTLMNTMAQLHAKAITWPQVMGLAATTAAVVTAVAEASKFVWTR